MVMLVLLVLLVLQLVLLRVVVKLLEEGQAFQHCPTPVALWPCSVETKKHAR